MARRLPPGAGCLGVGTYSARVIRRKTPMSHARIVGELDPVSGSWARQVDATSSASLTVPLTSGCCEVLQQVSGEPLVHELELFRDNDMVWAGPIVDAKEDDDGTTASLSCRDLTYWWSLRLVAHTLRPKGIDLCRIFEGYARYAQGQGLPDWPLDSKGRKMALIQVGDPPLVTDDYGLNLEVTDCGVVGNRTTYHHDLKYVNAELDDLADTGVDWTVVNRRCIVSGQEVSDERGQALLLPGVVTDDDYDTSPRIRATGEGMAYQVFVRGNGVQLNRGGPGPDGVEIQRVLDEYSIEDEASAVLAAESYLERGQEPLVYIEGQGALKPGSPVTIDQLVAGVRVRAAYEGSGCITFQGGLRLDAVNVSFDADGEKVNPTLEPLGAAGADARGGGG